MKIFKLAIFTIAFTITLSAQVHINAEGNEVESAILQVDASNKGISLPNVVLTSTIIDTPVASPKEGLMVYNTNSTVGTNGVLPGYYYWSAGAWHPIGKINDSYIFRQKIDLDVLGYSPTNAQIIADNTAGSITVSSVNYTKLGCVKWTLTSGGNDHTYCAYNRTSSGGGNWGTAYAFAQNRGGYLVTITSNTERSWLETNVINPKNLSSNIWLGYNKYQSRYIPLAGNDDDLPFDRHRYKWITGEKWAVNWENTTGAVVQSNFATSEPNIIDQNGCAYIGSGGTRQWYDRPCTESSSHQHIIVEFQDTY